MDVLTPFRATTADPWDADKAAHLARRAGFGARPAEIDALVALGPTAAVARFVDFPRRDEPLAERIRALGAELDVTSFTRGAYGEGDRSLLRRWWMFRMVYGEAQLAEKLTLLWHDHFACQLSKVTRVRLALQQNELFRAHAAGSFRELLRAVSRDPAMLVFLDNRLSEKGHPNENWARELVELFTLGVDRYTQRDVTELARVFTGWTTERLDSDEFLFDPKKHDAGDKVVFGTTIRGRVGSAGEREGDEALDLILARPDCARFLATKLLTWFAEHDPAPDAVDAMAAALVRHDWVVGEALRELFASAWFYAPERRFARYRNPVELVASTVRALELQNAHLAAPDQHAADMGMVLFEPPSVAGWDHGEAWVQTGTVAPRLNLALDVAELPHAGRAIIGRPALDLDVLADGAEAADALIDALARRLTLAPLAEAQRRELSAYLDAELPAPPPTDTSKDARSARRARVRAALHLLLASPQVVYA